MSILDVILEVNALLLIHFCHTWGFEQGEQTALKDVYPIWWSAANYWLIIYSKLLLLLSTVHLRLLLRCLRLQHWCFIDLQQWVVLFGWLIIVRSSQLNSLYTCAPVVLVGCQTTGLAVSVSDWWHKCWCAAAVTEQIGRLCASQRVIRRVQLKTVFVSVKLDLLSWDRSLNVNTSLTSAAWLKKNYSPRPRSRRRSTWDHWVCKVVTSLVVC